MNRVWIAFGSLLSICWAGSALASYSSVVLADNPASYYRFEETSGTTAVDSSGNGNSGTYMNGVLLAQPSLPTLGFAAGFDGTNDYVDTPRTVAGDFTLEAWINTTASSPTGTAGYEGTGLLWSDVGGSADDFILAILNNQLAFFNGNPDTTVTGGPLLNDGQWHHVVATRQQGVGNRIYVDGVLVGIGSTNNNPLNGNPRIHIGGNTLDSRYFTGRMDEVAYYPSVLSADSILAHYNAGITGIPTLGTWSLIALAFVLGVVLFHRSGQLS